MLVNVLELDREPFDNLLRAYEEFRAMRLQYFWAQVAIVCLLQWANEAWLRTYEERWPLTLPVEWCKDE